LVGHSISWYDDRDEIDSITTSFPDLKMNTQSQFHRLPSIAIAVKTIVPDYQAVPLPTTLFTFIPIVFNKFMPRSITDYVDRDREIVIPQTPESDDCEHMDTSKAGLDAMESTNSSILHGWCSGVHSNPS